MNVALEMVLARVRAILRLITGLNVPDTIPRGALAADLPLAIVIPRPIQRDRNSASEITAVRTIDIIVLLASLTGGVDGENETIAYDTELHEAIYVQFDGRRTLALNYTDARGIVSEALLRTDTGLSNIEWPPGSGRFFYGVSFSLVVTQIFRAPELA